jgi:hypothetical protein
MQREHVVMLAAQDLVADLHDERERAIVEPSAMVVGMAAAFFSVAYAVIISRGIRSCRC